MSELSPGLEEALSQDVALVFTAVEIILPSHNLRILDGSSTVTFDGKVFVGQDATYGTLHSIDAFTDAADGQAPSLKIALLPPTNTAAAQLASVSAPGSAVRVWTGALDLQTGSVVDDPDLWFVGELETPVLRVGPLGRILEFEVVSVWERFFADDEGARLTDAFHQYVWPGERGLEFVTEVQRQLAWGADQPRPTVIRDVPNIGFDGFRTDYV